MRRRPIVGMAIGYLLGTWLGFAFPLPLWKWCVLASGVWLAALTVFALRRSSREPSFSNGSHVVSLLMHVGIVAVAGAMAGVRGGDPFAGLDSEKVELIGTVVSSPDIQPGKGFETWRWQVRVRVEWIRRGEEDWRKSPAVITVRHGEREKTCAVRYGDRCQISGRIARPYGGMREGIRLPVALEPACPQAGNRGEGTPAPTRMRAKPISRAMDAGAVVVLSRHHGNRWLEWCYNGREAAAKLLAVGIEEDAMAVGLDQALVLGYRGSLEPELKKAFATTGTLHIFAISGLHVAMIGGFIVFVLRAFGISRVNWILFLAPLLTAYTLATGAAASAVRACIMGILFFLAPRLGRQEDTLSALAVAAFLILLVSPMQLFDPGFVLSFMCVLGLIFIYPPFDGLVRRRLAPDELRVQPEGRWIRMARTSGLAVGLLAAISLAAWIASTPLTAYYFQRLILIGLIGNLIVVPLSSLVLLNGCLAIVLGSCVETAAVILNHANLALIHLMVWLVSAMSRAPFGSIEIPSPALWQLALWYVAVALGLLGWRSRARRRSELQGGSTSLRPDPSDAGW